MAYENLSSFRVERLLIRHFRLSAYLYEITNNQTYFDATMRSHAFMESHLYNTTGGYIVDSFSPATCNYPNSVAVTYKQGLFLEALSVFAGATNNSTLSQLSVTHVFWPPVILLTEEGFISV